jgi:hypothetical protein
VSEHTPINRPQGPTASVRLDVHDARSQTRNLNPATAPFTTNKYLLVAYVYFFLNPTFFLDSPLLLTSLLSPLFYLWLRREGHKRILTTFLVVVAPFVIANLEHGVEYRTYAISFAMALTLYVTIYAFYLALPKIPNLSALFNGLIKVNLFMSAVGLVLLLTPWNSLMWITNTITVDVDETMRFRMLTYEPSYYSTLLVPLALYAFWRFMSQPNRTTSFLLMAVAVPLAMSFSFGVIGGLMLTIALIYAFSLRTLWRHKLAVLAFSCTFALIVMFLQDTLVWVRFMNVVSGQDTSANARTFESYFFAYQIAAEKSLWWGVGFGQVKLLDYLITSWSGGRLICTVADTFALFGILGLALRFGAEIYLFFKTRVYSNRFRLSLFLFMFIYQFTGSFTSNLAEYVVWILAFSQVFPEFSSHRVHEQDRVPSAAPVAILQHPIA